MSRTESKQNKPSSTYPLIPLAIQSVNQKNTISVSSNSKKQIKPSPNSHPHIQHHSQNKPSNKKADDKPNLLTVLQKYVTLQELKKHELTKQEQIKKLNDMETNLFKKSENQISSPISIRNLDYVASNNNNTDKRARCSIIEDFDSIIIQRIDIDPRSKAFCLYLQHEISKINEQVAKIQHLMNQASDQKSSKIYPHLSHFLNTIILTFNFILSKQAYKQQQYLQSSQHTQQLTNQLRTQFFTLQKELQVLRQEEKAYAAKENEMQQELCRIRSVMQSYQAENFQLRKEVNVLNEVIEQMNVQVQKAEKKLENKRKQFLLLTSDYEKMVAYSGQLQLQLKQYASYKDEAQMMMLESMKQNKEIKKWKDRCFQQQNQSQVL